jgi:hypothetical protein
MPLWPRPLLSSGDESLIELFNLFNVSTHVESRKAPGWVPAHEPALKTAVSPFPEDKLTVEADFVRH